jgi:hypothetical protein
VYSCRIKRFKEGREVQRKENREGGGEEGKVERESMQR